MEIAAVRENIERELSYVEGDFAVAFRSLQNYHNYIFINENKSFHAASTIKTAIMVEIFKKNAQQELSLDDLILVKNEFKSVVDSSLYKLNIEDDDHPGLYDYIGRKRNIRNLVYDMIVYSSNLATNILIEIVQLDKVQKTMNEIGCPNIHLLRGVEDTKAYRKGIVNTVTAKDQMNLFYKLGKGDIINKASSEAMRNILFEQHDKTLMATLLPPKIKIAHKTGHITGLYHDGGIVYISNKKRFALVLLSSKLIDPSRAKEAMSKVSLMVYNFMLNEK